MMQLNIEHCHRDDVDLITDCLDETGALSITLTDQYDDPILEPAPGAAPLWPHVVVHAIYAEDNDAHVALALVSAAFPHHRYALETVVEQEWERTCLDQFKPQQFGERLWVCPSWLTPPDDAAINLILDPGLAFGTGSHATTTLCLKWLEQAGLNEKTLIDYGCGSGILALAALKLGANHVHAVDIDEQALIATQDNAFNNDLSAIQLSVGQPEALDTAVDIIIANILLAPLLTLHTRFRSLLKENGLLVVSGLLADQVQDLIKAYQTHFIHESTYLEQDWALVSFKLAR